MIDADQIDWAKMDGLVPAIVQHAATGEVRMLGYMDRAALDATIADRLVTFHSRSRGAPCGRSRRDASAGLRVSELNAEITVEIAIVSANWR